MKDVSKILLVAIAGVGLLSLGACANQPTGAYVPPAPATAVAPVPPPSEISESASRLNKMNNGEAGHQPTATSTPASQ
jgi:hypothetical protein